MLEARDRILENVMRLRLWSSLSPLPRRRLPSRLRARSRTTACTQVGRALKQGETALAAGRLIEADDALEAALVVDPRNRAAFVAMAKVAIKQQLHGQAIRLTNRALALDPTDREALAVQGVAMVEQGAAARAKDVLAKLQKVCAGPCPQAVELNGAIVRGPSLAQASRRRA